MDRIKVLLFCTPPLWKKPYTVDFFASHVLVSTFTSYANMLTTEFYSFTNKNPILNDIMVVIERGNSCMEYDSILLRLN